jgi:hypothetical protein
LIGKINEFFQTANSPVGCLNSRLIGDNLRFPPDDLRIKVGVGYFSELVLCRLEYGFSGVERSISGGFGCLQTDNDRLVFGLASVIKLSTVFQFLLIVVDLMLEIINLLHV